MAKPIDYHDLTYEFKYTSEVIIVKILRNVHENKAMIAHGRGRLLPEEVPDQRCYLYFAG
jgi:hypothetical protein